MTMANSLYSDEEFNRLKEILGSVSTHIPTHLASEVWNNYRKIAGNVGNEPCHCGSSAGLWRSAVDAIHNYVKENS